MFHTDAGIPHSGGMTTTTHIPALRSAVERAGLQRIVVLPGQDGWDAARQAWNLAVDQHPAAVAFSETADDVVSIVRLAKEVDLDIVTQGTGHGAAVYRSLAGAILIRTTRMQGIHIEPDRARVGAGALWGEVAAAAGALGLAGLGGSSPDVGVVGYTLGGGIGWLSRAFGLAANSVRSIDLVTADATLRRVDHHQDPDLFWALRGGGGGLGVVTGIAFDLFPVNTVHAGTLAWPAAEASRLFAAWAEWTDGLDDSITSILRFLNLPPISEVPELFRGRRVITLGAAAVGDPSEAARQIDVMRRVAPPILDTFGPMPASELCRLHGDPEGPTPGIAHHTLLSGLDQSAIDRLVAMAGEDSGSPLVSVEVRHLGGALGRPVEGAGALSHIAAPYVLNAVGMAATREQMAATQDVLGAAIDAMTPWSAGTYLNFAERPGRSPFDPGTSTRLADVKSAFDPTGRFRMRATTSERH